MVRKWEEVDLRPLVLENMIKNFKKGFDGDYGKKMTPGRLRTLYEVEQLSGGVGWPPAGTMDLNLIKAVYAIAMGKPRHPDQFPYIDSWQGIAQEPPPPKGPVFTIMAGKEKS